MNNNSDIDAQHETTEDEQPKTGAETIPVKTSFLSKFGRKAWLIFRKTIYLIDRGFGDLVAVSIGLGIAALWMANSLLEKQSTDLTVLRPNIKVWFAEAFAGKEAEFGRLDLAWQPANDHIVVTVENAEIRGENGEVLERFNLIKSTVELEDGIFSRPQVINAEIKGGVLTVIENSEGQIIAGLGPPEGVGRVGPVYRSGEASQSSGDLRSVLRSLEFLQIQDVVFYFRNEKSGVDIKSNVNLLRTSFSQDGGLAVTASGFVDQTTEPMPFSINLLSDSAYDAIRLRLKVEMARLNEIGPRRGRFLELQGLSAPVDLTTDIDFSRREGLRSASVEVDVDPGEFKILRNNSDRIFALDSLAIRASLAPGEERMDVEVLDLKTPNLSFESSGFLTQLGNLSDGDVNSSPVFDLSLKNINANLTQIFPTETKIEGLKVTGQADVDSRKLEISRGQIDIFDSVHRFDGALVLESNNALKSLEFNSEMSGTISPRDFLSLWPSKSFPGARGWIEQAVLDADITKVRSALKLDEGFFQTRELTQDRLKFYFEGNGGSVRYMQTLPPMTQVSVQGEIIGNRLNVAFQNGQVGAINVTDGAAFIPVLGQPDSKIYIDLNSRGRTSDLLKLADYPPFEVASRYKIAPDSISGDGSVNIKLNRALTPFLPRDQIHYEVKGKFFNATAPFDFGKYKITDGNVTIDANRERALIKGPVKIGPWDAEITWLETLGDNALPTRYGISGVIDADLLDRLGFASRTVFDGSAAVQIDALGRGTQISGGTLDVDFTNSELSLERIWMKPDGEPAKLTGQLVRGSDNSYIIENALLNGAGIDVGGRIILESDFKLRQLDFSKMQIASLIDGTVKITPDRVAGQLGFEFNADYLNVSPWTEDLFQERKSNIDVPILMRGKVQNLILSDAFPVTNSEIYFSHTGEVVETARLEALSDGEALKLSLATREDLKRQFDVSVPDASKAVSAFLGLNNTTGGQLTITANLPAAGETGAYVGEAEMRDFRLEEAPALAKLLSLASLTGLADTLTSGSMQFDRFKVPFAILGDDIAIRDARLYGPAVGMTGNGDIDLADRELDFDGTLVPAYTANSILGDIPLLGDIFIQEKDGGLFALTYTVDGPFEQTQITVNPLSALTPGFLRGIFKRDRSDIDDAMKEAIQDVQPKQEAPKGTE